MPLNDAAGRRDFHRRSLRKLPQHGFQPIDTLEPPVPEQLRVIRGGNGAEAIATFVVVAQLLLDEVDIMTGMSCTCSAARRGLYGSLPPRSTPAPLIRQYCKPDSASLR